MPKPCDKPLYASWLPCCDKEQCKGASVWGKRTNNGECPWLDTCREYYRNNAGKLADLEKVSLQEQYKVMNAIKQFDAQVTGVKRR